MRRVELVGLVGLAGLYGLGWAGVAEGGGWCGEEGVCVSVCVRVRETVCVRERERREERGRESGREEGGRVREKEVVGVGMDHNGACHPHVLVGVSGQSQGHKAQGTRHKAYGTRTRSADGDADEDGMGMGMGSSGGGETGRRWREGREEGQGKECSSDCIAFLSLHLPLSLSLHGYVIDWLCASDGVGRGRGVSVLGSGGGVGRVDSMGLSSFLPGSPLLPSSLSLHLPPSHAHHACHGQGRVGGGGRVGVWVGLGLGLGGWVG